MAANIFDNPIFFKKYIEHRQSSNSHNELLEKPAIYSLLPNVNNLRVLDIGCGYGDFSIYSSLNNAKSVTAIDISSRMIQLALSKNKHDKIMYINDDIMNIKLEVLSFDLIFSSLTFHYISNIEELIKRIFQWLDLKSYFVLSIEHPINTANPNSWILDKNNHKIGWNLKDYNNEGKRITSWYVDGIEKYHRKTETYIRLFLEAGFKIDNILEPHPTEEVLNINPDLQYEKIRPPFLIFKLAKNK